MSSSSDAPAGLLQFIASNLAHNKREGRLLYTGLCLFQEIVARHIRSGNPISLNRLLKSKAPDLVKLVHIGRIKELLAYFGFREIASTNEFQFTNEITPATALERISLFSVAYQSWNPRSNGYPVALTAVAGSGSGSASASGSSFGSSAFAAAPSGSFGSSASGSGSGSGSSAFAGANAVAEAGTGPGSLRNSANALTEYNAGNGNELRRREQGRSISAILLTPVTEVAEPGDGNCFYYALFEALRAQNLLVTVREHYGLPSTKMEFVGAFRSVLADSLKGILDSIIRQLCPLAPEDREMILRELGFEYQTILRALTPKDCKNEKTIGIFIKALQDETRTDEVWAAQPEVEGTRQLLQALGIYLHIENAEGYPTPPSTPSFVYAPNRIILRRINGNHYHWYRYMLPPGGAGAAAVAEGGRRMRKTRKMRRTNTRRNVSRHL